MSTEGFVGKTVLITGASSGIGAGTALEFAKKGANLVLGGRNAQQLDETKKRCIEAGLKDDQIVTVIGDVVDDAVQQQFIDSAIQKFGSVDVLVNNAGIALNTSALTMKMEDFDKTMNVNLRSLVALTQKALPHLIKSKGNVVNISSICSTRPFQDSLAYDVSKAAVDMFTKCLAFEVAPQGVRVNAINPGLVLTNICRDTKEDLSGSAAVPKGWMDIHRIGRVGEVKEIADAILFLASNHASFVTGQLLAVCGGSSIPGVAL